MEAHYVHVAGVNHVPARIPKKVRLALVEAVQAAGLGRTVEIKS